MKKIIYSKLTKILVMLLTLVVGGMLSQKLIKISDEHADYSGKVMAVYGDNAYSSRLIDNQNGNYVMDTLRSIIINYGKDGMAGVQTYIDECFDRDGGNTFYVVIADENEMYSSFPDINVSNVTDYMKFMSNELQTEYSPKFGNSRLWLKPDDQKVYLWDYSVWYGIDGYIQQDYDITQVLIENDYKLAVQIYLTDYYDQIQSNYERDEYLDSVVESHEKLCNENISKNMMDVVRLSGAFIVFIVLSIFICGRTEEGLKPLNIYDKTGTEIHIAAIIIACLCAFGFLDMLMEMDSLYYDYYVYDEDVSGWAYRISKFGTPACIAIIAVIYWEMGVIIKKLKNRSFIKDWYVVKLFIKLKKIVKNVTKAVITKMREAFNRTSYARIDNMKSLYIRKITSDALMGIFVLIVICVAIALEGDMWSLSYFMYLACVAFIIFYFYRSIKEYRHLRQYSKIVCAVDVISRGNYDDIRISEDETDTTLVKLANLSGAFEESVRKQVESEKLQVELVANVSRDLKIPLASIVSYIDSLKEEKMSDVAKDYVKVLVDKAARLNDIVEDVFDLAKATSGEQVDMETLDGVMLIKQVLSDMNDRIEETGKILRVNIKAETTTITGNGQKLYRVFQNVIDNALKYSMPGTRIYLNAEEINGEFVVTIKNVSQYEINFTADEIMSRFTRGDKSRHSEGNGLGLSIAKSFTELCGGTFNIELDDDVFIATIRLR